MGDWGVEWEACGTAVTPAPRSAADCGVCWSIRSSAAAFRPNPLTSSASHLYPRPHQVEKERGITVKAQTASLVFKHKGEQYLLNLIDTPGHVDFSYEVSRSLAACQGAILLVDASQGVQVRARVLGDPG